MANTTYEEERKRPEIRKPQTYDYSAPQGTYYGEQGNAQSDMAEEILRRAAEQADPQRQAEDDARIQRGRNFWTGANLFANVVANAINVNGTAKGAPNMTWNDAASQKMYDTWRTADQQLKADRKAAQQRFDALRMQDAQMRAAGAEKRAAEAKAAFNINFQNEQAYQKAQNDAAQRDFEYERKKADEETARKQAKQDRIDFYDYQRRHPMPSRSGRSGSKSVSGAKTPSVGKNSIVSGGITMNVNTKADRDTMYKSMYNEMERWIKEHPEAMPEGAKMPTDEYGKRKFVDDHFGDLMMDNEGFRDDMRDYYGDLLIFDEEPAGEVGVGVDGYGAVQTMPWSEDFTRGLEERGVPTVTQTPEWKRQAPTRQNVQNQEGGYFLGSRRQPTLNPILPGNNAEVRTDGIKTAAYKVEGNKRPLFDDNGKPVSMENGRYVGTPRAAHKLTEAEKKAIEQNGEKPVFLDYLN